MDRHDRQARFPPIGASGQAALGRARVVVVGCGALGSVAADMLARAGVGSLRLIDRDVVEESNLHRVAMYTERDAAEGLPKAVAAAAHVRESCPQVAVEPVVADLDGANAVALLRDVDVVLD